MLNGEDPVHAAIPSGRNAGRTAAGTAVTAADLHRPAPRRQGIPGTCRGTRPACRARRPTWSARDRRPWRAPWYGMPDPGSYEAGVLCDRLRAIRLPRAGSVRSPAESTGGRCRRNRPGPLIRGVRPTARLNSRWRYHTKSIPNVVGIQPNRKNAGAAPGRGDGNGHGVRAH
jgi:hypothetical protein